MAAKDQLTPLAPPLACLNLDTSPSQIDPLESPEVYNMVPSEPGQIRRRRGWVRKVRLDNISTVDQTFVPFNTMVWGTRMLVGVLNNHDLFIPFYHLPGVWATPPAGYSTSAGFTTMLSINADDPANWVAGLMGLDATNGPFSQMFPLTPPSPYEFATFGTSARQINVPLKNGVASTRTRLVKWAGNNIPTGSLALSASINNGVVTGFFSTNPTQSLTNCFIRFDGDTAPFRYSYQIRTHTANTNSFTLFKPYGLGESVANVPNKATAACRVRAMDWVENSPPDVQCSAVHYDRLFVGRASLITNVGLLLASDYPNSVAWSNPTEPEKWTDTNFIVVDDRPDDAIMGFGHAGKNLLIFKRGRTYYMTGYSEQTFTVSLLTAEFGCLDARSIVQYKSGCAFMSEQGYKYIDESDIVEFSQLRPGHGIRKGLLPELSRDGGNFNKKQHLQSTAALVGDYIVVTNQDNRVAGGVILDSWAFYLKNRTWINWGNRELGLAPYCYTPANQFLNGRVCGIMRDPNNDRLMVAELDNMFAPETDTPASLNYINAGRFDEYYNAGVASEYYIPFVVRYKDIKLFAGDTGRVRNFYWEHGVQYINAITLGDMNAVRIETDVDPDIGVGVLTVVDDLVPKHNTNTVTDRYFIKEIRQGYFQEEAAVYRVKIHQTGRSNAGTFPQLVKIFGLRMQTEETRSGRVQS